MHWILILHIFAGLTSEGIHTYDFDSSETCNLAGKAMVKMYATTDDSGAIVEQGAEYSCVQR